MTSAAGFKIQDRNEQAEAEVVPSSSSVQFQLESELVGLRFMRFILAQF